jgi:hypothetical protein
MGTPKGFVFAATVTSAALVLLTITTLGAKPDKPDPDRPVFATDTVLVPKIRLQGGHGRAVGGGRKKAGAATGFLGAECIGTKYAIVIGISDYPGHVNDLDYADDDAILMTQILEEVYGFDDNNVITLTNRSATQVAVMGAISTIRSEAGPDDEVVFFFSGHGMNGTADDGDTEKTDEAIVVNDAYSVFKFAPIWDGQLRTAFYGFPTSRIIFIFDSCNAGGMDDLQEPGRVILMASTERGYAYEGPEWGNGEFTYYLAEGITTGAANVHDYGLGTGVFLQVTAEEAFDYAKANCVDDHPVFDDSFPDDLLP